jgi:hypothetical protein
VYRSFILFIITIVWFQSGAMIRSSHEIELSSIEDDLDLSNQDINRKYSRYGNYCNREKLSMTRVLARISWVNRCFYEHKEENWTVKSEEILQYPIGLFSVKGAQWHYFLPIDSEAPCELPKRVQVAHICYIKIETNEKQ